MLNRYPTLPYVLTGHRALYLGLTIFSKMHEGDALFFHKWIVTATKFQSKTRWNGALGRAAAKLIQLMEDNVKGLTR